MTFRRHMDRVEEVLRTVIPKGVGIECNTNRGNEPLPGPEILRLYRRLGGEIVTLGSDAHRPGDVGCCLKRPPPAPAAPSRWPVWTWAWV